MEPPRAKNVLALSKKQKSLLRIGKTPTLMYGEGQFDKDLTRDGRRGT